MNPHLQHIQDLIQQNEQLSAEQKSDLINSIKKVDKELEIISFKLDRTEKVKRTTAILLEETIEELEQKRMAVEETNDALKKSMEELKAAQKQLIHAEKMASLGELTAGIAHEIQNPLNFVNNFSELNSELLEELKEELDKDDMEEVMAIIGDLAENEEKIKHHGKRADGIVKGMLQHSRTSSGQKELTDINVLADEYLRLAFHGLRAKDKSFNADFKLELDENLPKIHVVPQDIGRVLLNLIHNSFYAVSEKTKQNIKGYKPEVIVTTNRISNIDNPQSTIKSSSPEDTGIEIHIKDNGPGIPAEMKEKIFQPFFTTKATGEGTGLGLSLSYDIITKGHGGELKLETSDGGGTCFTISIPINQHK